MNNPQDITLFEQNAGESTPDPEQSLKLDQLVHTTDERLFSAIAVWPFDFFPNKIFVEQKQVIIVYSQFFFTNQVFNILIEDILMPIVENDLFFATLKIELGPGGFKQNPPPIRFLPKADAQKVRRIIVGLLICHKEEIDFTGMTSHDILEKVEEIGRSRGD